MLKIKPIKRLSDHYRYPGFRPLNEVKGIFGDPMAREITLLRRSKKQLAARVARRLQTGMTALSDQSVISRALARGSFSKLKSGA